MADRLEVRLRDQKLPGSAVIARERLLAGDPADDRLQLLGVVQVPIRRRADDGKGAGSDGVDGGQGLDRNPTAAEDWKVRLAFLEVEGGIVEEVEVDDPSNAELQEGQADAVADNLAAAEDDHGVKTRLQRGHGEAHVRRSGWVLRA